MSEEINCPFCGNLIEVNAIKCPNCNALFKEPELPNIKFKELGPFIAIDLLTFGFFFYNMVFHKWECHKPPYRREKRWNKA